MERSAFGKIRTRIATWRTEPSVETVAAQAAPVPGEPVPFPNPISAALIGDEACAVAPTPEPPITDPPVDDVPEDPAAEGSERAETTPPPAGPAVAADSRRGQPNYSG